MTKKSGQSLTEAQEQQAKARRARQLSALTNEELIKRLAKMGVQMPGSYSKSLLIAYVIAAEQNPANWRKLAE